MLTIWGRTNSINVQKVMWTVGELGLEHERIDAGDAFGGLDTDAYGAMNPNRKIPVLRDGDLIVWESHACVRYLAARYGSGGLWPEDPAARSLDGPVDGVEGNDTPAAAAYHLLGVDSHTGGPAATKPPSPGQPRISSLCGAFSMSTCRTIAMLPAGISPSAISR